MLVRRIVAGSAALGLAVLGVAASGLPASAETPTTTEPAPAAAGWLATQLVDGNHMVTVVGTTTYVDQGLTADTVLAFDGAKVGQDAATQATTWLATPDQLLAYLGNGTTASYAGPHGKLALVAEAQGLAPDAFGGRHLLTELRALEAASGRFSDISQYGDYSNVFTQSYAVIALKRAGGDGPSAAAVDFLVGAQCPDGGFPVFFLPAACLSDSGATGIAAQALLAVGKQAPAARALDWLAAAQKADGGFDGPQLPENSNSTALAAQALRAGGRTEAANRAVAFLVARQVDCSGPAADQGAVAYDATGFKASTAPRATAAAVLALAGTDLVEVSATGAAGPAPRLACAPPSPSPSSPSPSSPSPTPSQPTGTQTATLAPTASGAASSGAASGGAQAGGGSLPATGAPVRAMTGVAVLLLATGCGLLVLARRQGAPRSDARRPGIPRRVAGR